jgi:hypothetical protein
MALTDARPRALAVTAPLLAFQALLSSNTVYSLLPGPNFSVVGIGNAMKQQRVFVQWHDASAPAM